MRRSKEIMLLFALLVGAMGFVLWYVIDRRAKNRAAPVPTVTARPETQAQPLAPNAPVALGTATTERKTIDFSSGRPVVKDSPEDQAAIDEALRDIAAASKSVTFEAKSPSPTPQPTTKP